MSTPLMQQFVSKAALLLLMSGMLAVGTLYAEDESTLRPAEVPGLFIGLLTGDSPDADAVLEKIQNHWHPGMVPMVIETINFSRNPELSDRLLRIMEAQTGAGLGTDLNAWYLWQWSQDENRHPHYASFKSSLYRYLDPKFGGYFDDSRKTTIRLDEIRWGGVEQDGIPPLRQPAMVEATEAEYLDDDDVVFGVAINGDARAYPKRILAWHEMFVDTIGGTDYAGVYCTLCGALILYETRHNGIDHDLGTSGFLYRSNKVMYDKATQSLWNTTWGTPVVGPLTGKDIALKRSYVVTTTWGEWRRRHPETIVLSPDTGHTRDYREGAAYQDYFATDELMFPVPHKDDRLANKAEILALQFPDVSEERVAISAEFLSSKPVYHHQVGDQRVVVLTDPSGASRVFDPGSIHFDGFDGQSTVTDSEGRIWTMSESALTHQQLTPLPRLPAHRAFWFGWVAVWEDTELVM